MPGPTSKGGYLGRGQWETLGNVSEQRAATLAVDYPACRVCGKPMVAGQERSNRGAHFTCTEEV
jgi:hypothetical protein